MEKSRITKSVRTPNKRKHTNIYKYGHMYTDILVAFKVKKSLMITIFLFYMQIKSFHNRVISLVPGGLKFSLPTNLRAKIANR